MSDGGSEFCPPVAPFAGYAAMGQYLPPSYPSPPVMRPTTCFGSGVQALASGYRPAPPPPGELEEGGIFLVPPPGALRAQCSGAARELGFAVPCPGLLPQPAAGVAPPPCGAVPRFASDCVDGAFFFYEQGGFDIPPGTGAEGSFETDLVIAAYPTADPPWRFSAAACPHGPPTGRVRVGGRPGRFFLCRLGFYVVQGGHLLLAWTRGPVTYQVSVFEDSDLSRRLLLDIGQRIRYVAGGHDSRHSAPDRARSPRWPGQPVRPWQSDIPSSSPAFAQ